MRKGIAVASLWLAGMGSVTVAHAANYDGADDFEQYGRRVHAAEEVSPVGDNVFGDQVSLYNGATTFEVTDVSIPGNNALPVALSRQFVIQDRLHIPAGGDTLQGFADWNFDVPYIDGTFTQANGWSLYGNGATDRCSDNTDWPYTWLGATYGYAPYFEVWDGNHLHIPGQGDQALLANTQSKSPAYASRGTYPWVTSGNWKLSCIASVSNLAGEGFVAVSPSGVSYTFNYAVSQTTSNYAWQYNTKLDPLMVPRVHIYLLATHVQDRFGNYVDYHYSGNELTSITSSDGRSITINWSGSQISSVTSALGTWSYGYATASYTNENGVNYSWPYLSTVTRPDGSQWTYTVVSGSLITTKHSWPAGDVPPSGVRICQDLPDPNTGSFVYRIGAPSGAVADFNFNYQRHYRDMVPFGCIQDAGSTENYPRQVADFFDNFTLTSKQISGPGLPTATWTYDYGRTTGSYYTASAPYNASDETEPFIPPGTCSACGATNTVTVTGPTSVIKSTFGTQYARNEAQLLDTEVDDLSGNPVKTTTNAYVSEDDAPSEPFPNIAGYDVVPNFQNPMGNRIRPVTSTQIAQDGATFTTAVNSFDAFARATSQTETGSANRTSTTSYYDDLSKWVLGQVSSTSVLGTAAPCTASTESNTALTSCMIYDATTDLPLSSYAFGKLVSTKAWNSDGTLHTITDGNGNITTLSNWYRGIPQSVQFADTTTQSAVVNDAGEITSVTDENGYTTGYGYDAMGRLSSIVYPNDDTVNWTGTTLLFQQVGGSEFGIPTGHWRQTVTTGNATTITYYDAFWRPLVTERYDAGNVGATLSQTVTRYDAGGRKTFTSYPLSSLSDYSSSSLTGAHSSYDALDRVTEVDADSELGTLKSTTQYLSGFQTKVTDPDGNVTTMGYQTFGATDASHPVNIVLPEGVTTAISRDVFGKPLTITRSGSYNGSTLSATRSYVYDANQQLCKRIDPESASTVFAYDLAGNLQWSAAGLNLPSTTSCDTSSAYSSGRRVDRSYDPRNRLATVTYPDGFSNTSFAYYPDGAVQSARVDNDGQPVTTTYSYNKRRLPTAESLSIPNQSPLAIGYGYDTNGNLAALTYPDGRSVTYLPNALGQPTQVGSYASGVSYYPNGAIRQFTYGDGTLHTMTQDARQLPDRSTDSYSGTAVLDDGHDYDADGNVAAITDYLSGNVGNRTMSYDGLDRLTTTVSPMFGGDNTAVFKYDPLDNLRSARVGNYSNANYQYDTTNRLTSLTDPVSGSSMVSYDYDVQGNEVARNTQTYQFDEANRLRGVPGVESYLYDALGRRAQKATSSGTVILSDYDKAGELMYRAVPASMTLTDYIYLGGNLLARVTNNTSNVIGAIDGAPSAGNPAIGGWACSTGLNASINVELFVGGPSGGGGIKIGTYPANLASEPAIASSCQSSGTNYRFSIALDTATRAQYAGQAIYLYGDSPVGNNNNQLDDSGQYTVPANPAAPDAPAAVTVPSTSSAPSVTMSWSASANTTSYVLQQSFNGGDWSQLSSGTATSFIATVNNGSYQYRVEACNANGCSAFTLSNSLSVAIVPAVPASVTAPASAYTASFMVSWSASANATNGYVLNQSLNGGGWTQVYSGTATSSTVTVAASGNYTYEVKACGAGGCSGYTVSGTAAVTLPPASAPSLSGPSSSTSGTYTLSWTAVSGATKYQLNQSINGGAWTAVYNGTGGAWTSSGVGSATYAYRAYGWNAAGWGPASNQVTVTVNRVPDAPGSMTAPSTVQAGTAFSISWSAASGASSYSVQRTNLTAGGSTIVYSGALTGTSTTPGPADDNYQYAVEACNANGCSGWTNAGNHTYVQPLGGKQSEPASGGSL